MESRIFIRFIVNLDGRPTRRPAGTWTHWIDGGVIIHSYCSNQNEPSPRNAARNSRNLGLNGHNPPVEIRTSIGMDFTIDHWFVIDFELE